MASDLYTRIKLQLDRHGVSERAASLGAGLGPDFIRSIKSGKSKHPRHDTLQRLADYLGCTLADLLPAMTARTSPINAKAMSVLEIDVRGGLGGGGEAPLRYELDEDGNSVAADEVRAEWHLPVGYLRGELHAEAERVRIIEVHGDSMEPTLRSGDRVMVHLHDRVPSPPGVFALWDGIGVVCKRVEHIPNSDPPRFAIGSDNPNHLRYERTADEINIIGRVIWFGRRL